MACGSNCCGPPEALAQAASPPETLQQPTSNRENDDASGCAADAQSDGCSADSCCGDADEPSVNKKSGPAPIGCQTGCCAEQATMEANNPNADSHLGDHGQECCAPPVAAHEIKDDCCDAPQTPTEAASPANPECCDGTTVPCCDDTCLDRLALRACEGEKKPVVEVRESPVGTSSSSVSLKSSECLGVEDGKPCGHHTRVTRDRYATTLAALGCICRALLALGQESCCAPKQRSSIDRKRGMKRSSSRSSSASAMSRRSVDSCCAKPSSSSHPHQHARAHKHAHAFGHNHNHPHEPTIHGAHELHGHTKKATRAKKGCCGDSPAKGGDVKTQVDSCGDDDSCCGDDHGEEIRTGSGDPFSAADLEKGHIDYEHIVISATGMTCTGCAKKLERTLATVQHVRNVKVSLILSRAEFDIDPRYGNSEDIMQHLERTSEFKCEKVEDEGFGFDVTVSDPSSFVEFPRPIGVKDVTVVDKKTVHIEYDPGVAKARDLVEKGWSTPLELAPPRPDPSLGANTRHVRNMGWKTLLSIVLTIPVLVMAWAPIPDMEITYGAVSLALATIVQVVVAGEFYKNALKSLIFSRMVEMDLLIVLSTSAAYIFSVIAFAYTATGNPLYIGQFFETSTLLVTLIMVGRWAAAWARQKAVESVSIRSLQASTATVVDPTDDSTKDIDTRLLQYGDIFKVAPDSLIPTDGTVVEGSSEVNESMITGESQPVEKRIKSAVIAGTINGSGTLLVRLSRLPGNNTISAIAGLVDQAKLGKPEIQELADKVASYFVPVILTIMLITFAAWIGVGIQVQMLIGSDAAIQAVTYAITVLIVSCPCAIGLAVPMVVVVGTGVAAKHGVIFKDSQAIEIALKTSHVVFDKTGTLTEGKLSVATEKYVNSDVIAPLLLGLVKDIKHPVSVAIATHLKAKGVTPAVISNVKAIPGKGVEGTSASGQILRAGNSRWLEQSSNEQVQQILAQSLTAFCFTIDNAVAAVIGLKDTVRSDALDTVQKLQGRGIEVHLVSGDDDAVVRALAADLKIPETNVRSRCTPADKQKYIQNLQGFDATTIPTAQQKKTTKQKNPSQVVIFCGDGTNDAVALAQASIGVAIQHANDSQGIGADVAKSAANVILVTPRLTGILTLINVSKKSVTRIWLNFGWSFVYNIFAILLGAGVFMPLKNVRIPPEYAGLGEIVSVLPVIAMAVQLRWAKV